MVSQETVVLYPSIDSHDLGPQQVDIHLFAAHAANGNHGHGGHGFKAIVPMVNGDGALSQIHLSHPAHVDGAARVGPGMIEVESIQRSSLHLYCIGGTLACTCDGEASNCRLVSPAPIVLIGKSLFDDDLDPVDLFVNELQAWISIQRAQARGHTVEFERLLLRIPPFTLYAHGLLLAAHTLDSVPVDERSERFWRASHTIHNALKAARARPTFPAPLPNLEPLLRVAAG